LFTDCWPISYGDHAKSEIDSRKKSPDRLPFRSGQDKEVVVTRSDTRGTVYLANDVLDSLAPQVKPHTQNGVEQVRTGLLTGSPYSPTSLGPFWAFLFVNQKNQPARNTVRGMEYFPPQLKLFNNPVLPRLKHPFYFETVV
jgi:hypothetical protein